MDNGGVDRAREIARRRLGSAFAEKATDELCLAYSGVQAAADVPVGPDPGATRLMSARREGFVVTAEPVQRAVIELQGPGHSATPAQNFSERLSEKGTAEAVSTALEALGEAVAPAERAISLLARQAAISAERNRFYRELGGLRDYVEHATAAVSLGQAGPPRLGIAAAPVQACWLSSVIRADTHASVLGDVAADTSVERIDLPRRIRREALGVTIEDAASLRANRQLDGSGVQVGVIDSEVQLDHPALGGRVVHRRNYTQEAFGTPDFHGTAIAGIIASSDKDFTGMAPAAVIYNYKVLATQSALDGDAFDGQLAIQHALEDGMRVVNCSWGNGPAGDGTGREARACDAAWRLGMTIVKSAGNAGPGPETLTTPADAEGVLVVGASTTDGKKVPDYSSRGPAPNAPNAPDRPHLIAPGGDIGGMLDGILTGGGAGELGDFGTSFAAPHVTGLVALLIESEPELTPDQQRDRIIATCKALPGVGAEAQGAGLVTPSSL